MMSPRTRKTAIATVAIVGVFLMVLSVLSGFAF